MADWQFPDDTVAFLRDLKANNSRDWFQAQKTRYTAAIKKPAAEFCEAMEAELTQAMGVAHSSKIFRINRDLRFSKDKTPYNAHLHISFLPQGTPAGLAWFFGLEVDRLVLGTGSFGFDKAALDAFRQRVAGDDGAYLAKALAKLSKAGTRLGDAELKRVPAPWPADHPRANLLRHKSLTVWTDQPHAVITPQSVLKGFTALKPVHDWLAVA